MNGRHKLLTCGIRLSYYYIDGLYDTGVSSLFLMFPMFSDADLIGISDAKSKLRDLDFNPSISL